MDFAAAMEWQVERLATLAQQVEYRPGGDANQAVDVRAIVDVSNVEQTLGDGAVVVAQFRDYVVWSDDLGSITPAAGDIIVDGGVQYEVVENDGLVATPCDVAAAHAATLLRVHTQRLALLLLACLLWFGGCTGERRDYGATAAAIAQHDITQMSATVERVADDVGGCARVVATSNDPKAAAVAPRLENDAQQLRDVHASMRTAAQQVHQAQATIERLTSAVDRLERYGGVIRSLYWVGGLLVAGGAAALVLVSRSIGLAAIAAGLALGGYGMILARVSELSAAFWYVAAGIALIGVVWLVAMRIYRGSWSAALRDLWPFDDEE